MICLFFRLFFEWVLIVLVNLGVVLELMRGLELETGDIFLVFPIITRAAVERSL
jgi:hypothetical protein